MNDDYHGDEEELEFLRNEQRRIKEEFEEDYYKDRPEE